jgi:hypothetical protein
VPAGIIVTFDPSLNGMAIGLTSAITISQSQTLQGPGAATLSISGGAATQLFVISSTVSLSGLTFTGGAHAGATSNGGAIDNEDTLTVTNCAFTSNTAGQYGGAVFNAGTLTVASSTFTSNTAYGEGGGLFNDVLGTMTITGSTFTTNNAPNGAGILNDGTLDLRGSTLTGNTAANEGGGIFDDGTLTVINSTFTGNSGTGAALAESGAATLLYVTASANAAVALLQTGGTATVGLQNSLIAANTGGDLSGTFTSLGYNMFGTTTGGTITLGTGDVIQPAPGLDPLGNYGGLTQTMLPATTSPAVNVIPTASCGKVVVDERGLPRPGVAGGNCTIGAVERQTGDIGP